MYLVIPKYRTIIYHTSCRIRRRPNVVENLAQIVYHLIWLHLIMTSRHPEPDDITQVVRSTLRPLRISKDDMDNIQIIHLWRHKHNFILTNIFPPHQPNETFTEQCCRETLYCPLDPCHKPLSPAMSCWKHRYDLDLSRCPDYSLLHCCFVLEDRLHNHVSFIWIPVHYF